ncbi:MAG: hypothetical protein PHX88_11840 [Methanoculleus horonobensis]|jgi:hypothetical protein|nr:hypothetical protein [Methanoculleus horonobensis]
MTRFGDDPDWEGEREVRDRITARTDRVGAEDRRHAIRAALGNPWFPL